MRLNELHKFSDGTLTRVMEKLDQMVKDFHLFEYNKGMETRKWSEDDKRRSKDFITAIEKRLQIRRIYRKHPSETIVFHNEDGNPARANIKQALGYRKDGDGDGKSQFLRCQVIHTVKIDEVRQIVDVESSGKSVDVIDKESVSLGEKQLKQGGSELTWIILMKIDDMEHIVEEESSVRVLCDSDKEFPCGQFGEKATKQDVSALNVHASIKLSLHVVS
ncbi:hypothetical protein Tco_0914530 [Tanacetum coccineum]